MAATKKKEKKRKGKWVSVSADRNHTDSRRIEPSSRSALLDEQSNPWDLIQPQEAKSRHRGAKPSRR